jgi:hypothetical protein
VPVREIARVIGVAERTIYKYAAKQRWKKRYARAPEKGAGSRFIRREHRSLPFAQGLKATDPAGAQRAKAACRQAAHLSKQAQAEAEREQRAVAIIKAMEWTCRALSELREYLEARDKQQPALPAPRNDRIAHVYERVLSMALSRWQALLAEEEGNAVIPAKAGIQ